MEVLQSAQICIVPVPGERKYFPHIYDLEKFFEWQLIHMKETNVPQKWLFQCYFCETKNTT
jgi:hypothetical protein